METNKIPRTTKATAQPKYLIVTRGIVTDADDRIVLVKRPLTSAYNPGKWELPGGKWIPGETLLESTEQNILREIGVIVSIDRNITFTQSRFPVKEGKYKGYHYIEIAYLAKYSIGDLTLTGTDGEASPHKDLVRVHLKDVFSYDLSLESRKILTEYAKYLTVDIQYIHKSLEWNFPTMIVSRALIFNEQGEILLLKRAIKAGSTNAGKWELPGGKVGSFEIISKSLEREVLEETGLLVEASNQLPMVQNKIVSEGKYKSISYFEFCTICKLKSGTVRLTSEHDEYKWIAPAQVSELDVSPESYRFILQAG